MTKVLRNGFLSHTGVAFSLPVPARCLKEFCSLWSGGTCWCPCVEKQSAPSARVLVAVLESGEFANGKSSLPPAHSGTM